jgi:hypothetical protein
MPLEKSTNGVKLRRWQMPFQLLFAGTVYRAQGMSLERVVGDYRTKFWEHGQLYLALSRVRDPHELCVLLPSGMSNLELEPGVDPEVVRVLDSLHHEAQQGDFLDDGEGELRHPPGLAGS